MQMQRQLMDMTEYANGSIFDNIIKINEKLSKKLKLKIDLRSQSGLNEEENQGGKIDQVKILEEKLDNYILDFVNLNNRNKEVLKETHHILDLKFADKLREFEIKLEENVEKLTEKNNRDDSSKQLFKKEMEVYVTYLREDMERMQN